MRIKYLKSKLISSYQEELSVVYFHQFILSVNSVALLRQEGAVWEREDPRTMERLGWGMAQKICHM
jgi:hypothetical protein